jgi:hypothetical protein
MKWFLSYEKWSKLAKVLCKQSSKVQYNPFLLNSSNLNMEGLLLQANGLDSS